MTDGRIRRIVTVDDDERTLRLLVDALESEDMEVLTFDDGEVAISYLTETAECDLLIVDLEMPKLDSFTLVHTVRQLPLHAAIPILVLSGLTGPGIAERVFEAGANAYRTKPITIKELETQVFALLNRPH